VRGLKSSSVAPVLAAHSSVIGGPLSKSKPPLAWLARLCACALPRASLAGRGGRHKISPPAHVACCIFGGPFTATLYARASASTQPALPCQGLGTGQTSHTTLSTVHQPSAMSSRLLGPAGLPRGPPSKAPAPRGRLGKKGRGERGREGEGAVSCLYVPVYVVPSSSMRCHTGILRVFVRSPCLDVSIFLCVCRVFFITASASLVSLSLTSCRFSLSLARSSPGPFLHLRL
jgi:hypothetical protein